MCACVRPSDTRPAPRPPSPGRSVGRPTDGPRRNRQLGKRSLKKKIIYIYHPTYAPPDRVFYLFIFFFRKSIKVQGNARVSEIPVIYRRPVAPISPRNTNAAVPVNGHFLKIELIQRSVCLFSKQNEQVHRNSKTRFSSYPTSSIINKKYIIRFFFYNN